MRCIVEIEMDNAAFFRMESTGDGEGREVRDGYEVARLLLVAADAVKDADGFLVPVSRLTLRDYNGNTVGSLTIEGD